jgi:hypothetical protein
MCFVILVVSAASAQGKKAVPPPSKPADDGPSLKVTMKFIQDKLNDLGPVKYVQSDHDNSFGLDWKVQHREQFTNVVAHPSECRVSFHQEEEDDGEVVYAEDDGLFLKEVKDIAVMSMDQYLKDPSETHGYPNSPTVRVDPPVFVLEVRMTNKGAPKAFYFFDEQLANRLAKAMVHAVEFCGGSKREPFQGESTDETLPDNDAFCRSGCERGADPGKQEKKTVPPPPKPEDDGPNLEVTMKFIQDKMNNQGNVGYVFTYGNVNGVLVREDYLISDVVADASTCTLHVKEKFTTQVEVAHGARFAEGGKVVRGDDLQRERVETSTSPFKDVDSITVEPLQDADNRNWAKGAHPEVTVSYTSALCRLSLNATKKDAFSFHALSSKGKRSPQNADATGKQNGFTFRDEEIANRVAKAMVHAVELCGGGGSKPEPF